MKDIKIVTIGGGSSYTPELIEGFILRQKELDIKEIWLVDIEEGKVKLEIVGEMAKRMVKAAGLDWEVKLTLDRKEALKDADFVTTQLRVGQLDARILDERLPNKYGMIGQETNGAGGIFKAFRTIPVILDIIEDMKELAPNAWLINFTNPAGMVTEAAVKHGGWHKTIGLCNVPIGSYKLNHQAFEDELEEDTLYHKYAGLNHFHYHRIWDESGKERTDDLIEKIFNPENIVEGSALSEVVNIEGVPFIYPQIKAIGMIPCAYHRYYYLEEEMLKQQLEDYANNVTRAEVVKETEAELFELYKDPNLDHKPEQLAKRGGAHYSDAACELIASIVNDKRSVMVVSTHNKGVLSDLPYDSIVEVSSIITAHGPKPMNWGGFGPEIRGQIQLMKSMEELVIEAAVTGDYNTAVQAFTINPLIKSGNSSIELLNELLLAHKNYLPQFADKIKELEAK